ncbi:MAG: endonuclease VIII [Gammaproteobacteria bacterium]|nr:endonuclease VIII [Gammaproteobacteria bacterium]
MPEGPEIRRARDELAEVLFDREVQQISFAFARLKPFEPLLTGQTIVSIESRGKAMLIGFSNGYTLYSHNQLYGRWMIVPVKQYPQISRQLRLAIHGNEYSALLYSASEIEVLDEQQLLVQPYLQKLGLELLAPETSEDDVYQRLNQACYARRNLMNLLQDQSVLSGMGNYLCCEALHASGIHPQSKPGDLTDRQIKRLARNCLGLSRLSYQTRGITNSQKKVAQLKRQGVAFEDYRFQVYRRAGQTCYQCGELIVKGKYAGRMGYICPSCQSLFNK